MVRVVDAGEISVRDPNGVTKVTIPADLADEDVRRMMRKRLAIPQTQITTIMVQTDHPTAEWKASEEVIIITFTWSGPRWVAGYTEAHACAWHVCQLSLSDP
jgi:hypothetical protein